MGRMTVSEGAEGIEDKKEDLGNIVSIELLEGNTETTDIEVIQFVNIQQNQDRHVDKKDVTHIDRLGQKLRLKVKFDKPGNFRFEIELKPDGSNVNYTSKEKERNRRFNYNERKMHFWTDDNGETVIESINLLVSPAGNDVFEITATDENGKTVVAKSKVRTKRLLYYVEAKMTGLTTIASSLGGFRSEYDKHSISFKDLPCINISYIPNIGKKEDEDSFKKDIQEAYKKSEGPAKIPYSIIIAYTDHLAVKDPDQKVAPVNAVGGSITPVNVPIIKRDSIDGNRYSLWHNIMPEEDWFVECYFLKDGGSISDRVVIDKSRCTPVQAVGCGVGDCDSVDVDISGLAPNTGKIILTVNWVNRMRGGLSFPKTNIIAVRTRAWWQNKSNDAQNQVIVHEIGHQLGMVSDGTGKLPDKTSYLYDTSKGHIGNHCHMGIPSGQSRYDSQTDGKLSMCVMYGATNGKIAFCIECAKVLQKVDLENGV